jgi:hypothetical protein
MGKESIMKERSKIWLFVILSVGSFIILVIPLLLASLSVFLIGLLLKDSLVEKAGFNMLVSVDQFGNVVLLGDPDETISSRTGRALLSDKPRWFVKHIHYVIDEMFHMLLGQKNHCISAVEKDVHKNEIWSWIKRSSTPRLDHLS